MEPSAEGSGTVPPRRDSIFSPSNDDTDFKVSGFEEALSKAALMYHLDRQNSMAAAEAAGPPPEPEPGEPWSAYGYCGASTSTSYQSGSDSSGSDDDKLRKYKKNQCGAIENFLGQNPAFLKSYVLNNVSGQTLSDWLAIVSDPANSSRKHRSSEPHLIGAGTATGSKIQMDEPNSGVRNVPKSLALGRKSGPSTSGVSAHLVTEDPNVPQTSHGSSSHSVSPTQLYVNNTDKLQTLLKELTSQASPNIILFQTLSSISKLIDASTANLFVVSNDGKCLEVLYSLGNEKIQLPDQAILESKTLSAFVAFTKHTVLIRKYYELCDDRFPDGVNDRYYKHEIHSVIAHPIVKPNEELFGVMEFLKYSRASPFTDHDVEIVGTCNLTGMVSYHFFELNNMTAQQKKLNDFLLKVTSSIFQDMESIATLIFKIMKFGRKLVNADRASLFLLDRPNQELYASIFDVGGSADNDMVPIEKEKIRFPIGTGIAGSVASTGHIENIKDAYKDERFNRNVDVLTGYHTKSILCMPIYIRNEIIGVMQMVNKKDSTFNETDEKNFESFAIYCGLALYHAQLYEKIYRSEKKYKVAMEVLSYHITANQEEVLRLRSKVELPAGVTAESLASFDFCRDTDDHGNDIKPELVLYMYVDLFGQNRIDLDLVARFILTVKKNYRTVPYHNWTHGFFVAHMAYVILKAHPMKFNLFESLALFVSSLCHDLDHRGKNNTFMKETETPLAAIYSTSTMEHHHFNQTVAILQQEGHNIFGELSSTDYRKVLSLIKHCILATDLAQFFPFKARLLKLLESGEFSWDDHQQKMLALAIIMTSCDLCASAKPWKFQQETVDVIMEEFFQQGDAEKAKGKTPIPLMDRKYADQLPKNQVGFIKGICIPCYQVLTKLLPKTSHLLEGAERNCEKWSNLIKDEPVEDGKGGKA